MGHYPSPIVHPPRGPLPILLSIPHAGRDYDPAILANALQGRHALEALEDPLVDQLVRRTIAADFGAVIQPVPRATIDCNREENEVDPAAILGIGPVPVGPRARYGLGLVPSRIHYHGQLWRRPINRAELTRRIEQVHRPYHQMIAERLSELVLIHGSALLLDCHSMPPQPASRQIDIVIGDRHGTSAAGWISGEAARIVREAGFSVAINEPYAGGAIIARHGQPSKDIHALQLEIDRRCYLECDGRTIGPGFDQVAVLIETLATSLGQALVNSKLKDAAE